MAAWARSSRSASSSTARGGRRDWRARSCFVSRFSSRRQKPRPTPCVRVKSKINFGSERFCKHTAAFVPAARRKRTQRPAQLNAKNTAARGCTHVARLQHLHARRRRGARQRRDVAVVAALGLERLGRVRRRRPARARAHAGAARVQTAGAAARTASRPAIDMARRQDMLDAAFPLRRRRPSATPAPPRRASAAPPPTACAHGGAARAPSRRRRRPSGNRRRRRLPRNCGRGREHSLREPIRDEAAAAAAAKPHRQPLGTREMN